MRNRSVGAIVGWAVAGGLAAVLLLFLFLNKEYRTVFLNGSGFAYGAMIGAIALGIVLTYRGSGVVNLSNGAVAMYVAYVYTVLRNTGKLFLPPLPNPLKPIQGIFGTNMPNLPVSLSLGSSNGMGIWPALAISLAFCVLLGLAFHFLIFRPLRHAPPLAKVVASVGVFVFLQATIILRFSITSLQVKPLPVVKNTTQVHLGITTIAADQLFVAVVVIALSIALWLVFQYTRFGLATRAAAENEKGAVVLGFSPDFLAGINWVLAMLITGALGIMVASTLGTLEPTFLTELIVPALTAALVGSFSSFGRTTVAAFLLGMQIPLVQYVSTKGWFPASAGSSWPGFEYLLPAIGIVIVLFAAGRSLPERGAITASRLPFSPTPPKWAIRYGGPALAILAAVLGLLFFNPLYRGALSNTLVGAIICLSIVVITGFVGQISLAQMSFAGIAAFFIAKISTTGATYNLLPWHVHVGFINVHALRVDVPKMPFPIPILLGAVVATGFGLLVALPALRVRGVNLAIVTLAFAVAVDHVAFVNNSVTGGYNGAPVKVPSGIDTNSTHHFHFLGLTFGDGLQPNVMTAMFALVVLVILCYLVANIRRSTTGRQMLAMRSNERAAAAAGVSVSGTKMLAFGVSAFIAGVGGGVIAYQSAGVTAAPFAYTQSLVFFAFAYLGGITCVSGALWGGLLVQGGLLFTFLSDKFGIPSGMTLVLGGLGLVLTAVLNPEGIAGGMRLLGERIRSGARARARPVEPKPVAVAASTEGTA